jgi:8-demethyl-8-alpha-L-rhamnosyltetracenomycin-C 2'-O-methyltransferase
MTTNHQTLDQLAILHGTDKSSKHHNYCVIYEKFFEPLRDKDILLFEAGSGGYHYPGRGFEGARTWRQYFSLATIVSTDIHPKTNIPDGVLFEQGSQDDLEFWQRLVDTYGQPNVFIDDASHINPLTIDTFRIMFPMLKSGGTYVVEDLESSFWGVASDGTDFKGCSDHTNLHTYTTMNFLRRLINDVNAKHIKSLTEKYEINSIHFYENIAFIQKK